MGQSWVERNFYCINCGAKGVPILRAGNKLKQKHHRKKMYCLTCKHETNHVECRNAIEVEEFMRSFENGEFLDEAKETLQHEQEHPRLQSLCSRGMSRVR